MKPLLLSLCSLCIILVSNAQNLLSVDGRIDSWKKKKVFLLEEVSHTPDGNIYAKIDSVQTRSGKFSFKHAVKEINFYALATEDLNDKVQFIWDTTIQVQGKDVTSAIVQGSALSQSWRNFHYTTIQPAQQKLQDLDRLYQNALVKQDSATIKDVANQIESTQNFIKAQEVKYLGTNARNFLSLYYLICHWQSMGINGSQQFIRYWPDKLKNHTLTTQLSKEIKKADTINTGNKAPVIVTRDIDGIPFNSSTLAGKYVLIDFWGTWCIPCMAMLPELREVYQKYKSKNVEFISVAYEKKEDIKNIKPLIRGRYNISWTQLCQEKGVDPESNIIKKYMIEAFPTVVLISPDGKILSKESGNEGLAKAQQILNSALEK